MYPCINHEDILQSPWSSSLSQLAGQRIKHGSRILEYAKAVIYQEALPANAPRAVYGRLIWLLAYNRRSQRSCGRPVGLKLRHGLQALAV